MLASRLFTAFAAGIAICSCFVIAALGGLG